MIKYRIKVTGGDSITRVLQRTEDGIKDLSRPLSTIGHRWLLAQAKKNFDTQGAHGGRTWAGYDAEPKYGAFKASIIQRPRLLRWTPDRERLFPSLTRKGAANSLFQATPSKAVFGTSLPYAAQLARGGVGPFGEAFPGRNPLSYTPTQAQQLADLILFDLMKRIKGRGQL